MTHSEIIELMRKKNKFGAVRTNGKHSKLEASVGQILKWREMAKEIKNIRSQHTVKLTPAEIHYAVDYSFEEVKTGQLIFCEAKGVVTERYAIIEKLWRFYGPAPLQVWKGDYKRPHLYETIIPKGYSHENS